MLNQGRVLVVQDQFFQRAVKVVGLGEAVSRGCLVDDAVLDLAIHTARTQRDGFRHQLCAVSYFHILQSMTMKIIIKEGLDLYPHSIANTKSSPTFIKNK